MEYIMLMRFMLQKLSLSRLGISLTVAKYLSPPTFFEMADPDQSGQGKNANFFLQTTHNLFQKYKTQIYLTSQ